MSSVDPSRDGVARARAIMSSRAKTFRVASLLLGPALRDDAAVLYAFCRAADDAADEASDVATAQAEIDHLARGLSGDGAAEGVAVCALAARRGMPVGAAHELLAGVRRDLSGARIEDDAELLEYAYLVAGTVGVLMCALLGAREPRARRYAIQLGLAMQLTNICRDVAEDAARGRVYLPARRLRAAGTSQEAVLAGTAPRDAVAQVVSELLTMADGLYASAELGVRFLPTRGRLAVLVASRLYRAIGLVLRRRGCDPSAGRAVVPATAKVGWIFLAIVAWLGLTMRRSPPLGVAAES